jgi:hypothetical protein
MNTNGNQFDSHQDITTKNCCAHSCTHECPEGVEPRLAPHMCAFEEEKSALNVPDKKQKNLERAIVIGTVLILVLVAAVFYWKFTAQGNAAGDPNLEISMPIHY